MTLEDVIEELIAEEIYDETDAMGGDDINNAGILPIVRSESGVSEAAVRGPYSNSPPPAVLGLSRRPSADIRQLTLVEPRIAAQRVGRGTVRLMPASINACLD